MSPLLKTALKVHREQIEANEARTKLKLDALTDALREHAKAIKQLQSEIAALQSALMRHSQTGRETTILNESA